MDDERSRSMDAFVSFLAFSSRYKRALTLRIKKAAFLQAASSLQNHSNVMKHYLSAFKFFVIIRRSVLQ